VDFLTTVYESGGNNFFDAVAFHPYNDGVEPSLYLEKYVTNLHDVMLKYGDSDKKIWVTEFGSYSGTSPDAVSEPLQAEYLTRAFTILHNMEFVDCAYWYNLKDYTTTPNPANPAINYGLFRYDGSRRPAADSLKDFLQSTPN
jgi:hypothetical protein